MPTAQLLHGIAESIVNPLIQLDPNTSNRLTALKGQRLVLFLEEVSWPIELAFEDGISIHEFQLDWQTAAERNADNECLIKASLSTLVELKDSRQITRLIREHKLDLDGDMHIAQRASALFQELEIDWEEVLSSKVGDVAAYQFMQAVKQAKASAEKQFESFSDTLASALIDEKKLAAHRLQVIHFIDQVSDVRDATERLAARISRLENDH